MLTSTIYGLSADNIPEHLQSLKWIVSIIRKIFDNIQVLSLLCAAAECDEMPVRHNEDKLNLTLSTAVRYKVDRHTCDDSHTKTNLLLQVHFLIEKAVFSHSHCLLCVA